MTAIKNAFRRAGFMISHGSLAVILTIGYQPETLTQTTVRIHAKPQHEVAGDLELTVEVGLSTDSSSLHNIVKSKPQPAVSVAVSPSREIPRTPQPAPGELEGWFNQYGEAFNVDPEVLKSIAKCESGYRQDAVNGPYGGMYQYLATTWSSTRNAMGADPDPSLRFNAKEAIFTTAWKISVGGIGAWPHCGKLAAVQATATGS